MTQSWLRAGLALCMMGSAAVAAPGGAKPAGAKPDVLHIGGAEISVEFNPGKLDATHAQLLAWVTNAANAVTAYFGRFPVEHYRIAIQPIAGETGVDGTTWSYGGAHTTVRVGEHTTVAFLDRDWVMTHEMVHNAFPDQPDEHHWIEEGTATYIEPLARSWVGNYPEAKVWTDLIDGAPRGLPGPGDHGLDHTPTWGRTYWGGALFCLLADVEIRERTNGQRGLVDAMRGILAAGGNNQADWSLDKTLAVADKAVGVPVLEELYKKLKDAPVTPDLDALWRDLGITVKDGKPVLDDHAPHAAIRRAISTKPADAASAPAPKR